MEPLILHASTVVCNDRAVLIRGASGAGKSALALELISRGAKLVADDRTQLLRTRGGVRASCPPAIAGLIEARGMGILNVPAMAAAMVALVVDLDRCETRRLPEPQSTSILGLQIPLMYRVDAAYFPAAIQLYLQHGH